MQTLFRREVWRFMKVWNQTLTAPVVTTVIFYTILTVALGRGDRMMGNLSFEMFIMPGLIMMTVIQNAFANTSSSFMLQKIQGVIVDLLMPPLSPSEITIAMTLGGVVRGVMVGITVGITMYAISVFYLETPMNVHSWLLAIAYILLSSSMLALLGMLTGIWSQSFDQLAAITNYVVTPLSFLSGTFYSISYLPEMWMHISSLNPFYYMIDGFRYAITGFCDADITTGLLVLVGCNIVLAGMVHQLLLRGYRLKS